MSNSAMPGEDASWAQTFITVTPHEDGFLREIEDNVVVSGSGDTPFHLDTWNIVLRRSLVNTTKHWVDPSELEKFERIETECQTYLQGVPKVELPLVYKDEATQTLYIGRDGIRITTPMEYFNDITTILNENTLPEQKTSHVTQTTISMKDITFENDVATMLTTDSDMIASDSQSSIDEADKESAVMEALDILNFAVERTLWMTTPQSASKKEKKDANVQTSLMYNHRTKKVAVDYEAQTELTCEPKYSNSMLLADYNETKEFCRRRVNQCIENGVYPRIDIDNIVEEIINKCKRQINFYSKKKYRITSQKNASSVENVASSLENVKDTQKKDEYYVSKVKSSVDKQSNTNVNSLKSRNCNCGIASEINRVTRPIRDAMSHKYRDIDGWAPCSQFTSRYKVPRCPSASTSESTVCTSSSGSSQPSSSSARSLPTEDVQALSILKNAFGCQDAAENR